MNKTLVTYAKNPYLPAADREQFAVDGMLVDNRLSTLLAELPFDFQKLDVLVYVNGAYVDPEHYSTYTLSDGNNHLVLKQRLHGGDDSNPLAIIATIALIVFTAGVANGAFLSGITGGAGFGASAAAVGIQIAGTVLINTIFPPTLPKFDAGAKASPTYSLSGSRNQARIEGVLPIVVGTHKMVPDLGAKVFTSQNGKDTFLHQVFNFGLGDLTISDERIGNTPIANHEELITETSDGTGVLELFPTNVDSIAGAELRFDDGFIVRTTSVDTTSIALDFTGNVFRTNDDGSFGIHSVPVLAEYRPIAGGAWLPFQGGPGRGGRGGRGGRVGGFTPAGQFNIIGSNADFIRVTVTREVAQGQYEVRTKRVSKESDEIKIHDTVQWSQLRSFQPDQADYSGQTRYALQVRGSGQFSNVVDQFNAIVSNSIPVWNGSTEPLGLSSNPADIFIYLARGLRDASGKLVIGAGLSDSKIDLAGLRDWQAWCTANSLLCDFVFDRDYTVLEMLSLVARCGRASPTQQKGVLGVVYDEEDKPIVQQFGMANIIKDSFNVDYITQKTADQITVKFFNKNLDWQPDTVTVNVPNIVTPASPVEIELAGITSPVQAEAEANLIAARQFYNRRRVSFESDLEGLVCTRGDVIGVSHDLTNWAASGRLISGTTTDLVLDRDVTFVNAQTYFIAVRIPDGTIETVGVDNPSVGPDVITNSITLSSALSINPDTDLNNDPIDYIWSFDPQATPGFKLKVVAIEPTDENRIRIVAVDENTNYYAAANNSPTYVAPTLSNTDPASVINLVIEEEWQGVNRPLLIHVNWELENADNVLFSFQRNSEDWVSIGQVNDTQYTIELQRYATEDIINIQLVPQALALRKEDQNILEVQYVLQGQDGAINNISVPAVTGLELFDDNGVLAIDGASIFTGSDAKFVWRKVGSEQAADDLENSQTQGTGSLDQSFLDYEVTITNTIGVLRRVEYVKDENYLYTLEKNKEDGSGVPLRKFKCLIRMRTQEGLLSGIPARLTVYNPPPAAPTGLVVESELQTIAAEAVTPVDIDFAGIIVHVDTATLPSTPQPTDSTLAIRTAGTSARVTSADVISTFDYNTTYHVRVAFYDDFGDTDLNFSPDTTVTPAKLEDIGDGVLTTANFAASIILNRPDFPGGSIL